MRRPHLLRRIVLPLALFCLVAVAPQRAAAQDDGSSTLLENVARTLAQRSPEWRGRRAELSEIVARHLPQALRARTIDEQRQAAHDMLAELGTSYTAVLSRSTYGRLLDDLAGRPAPTLGFELIEIDGDQFAFNVLEGGPAERAGLRRGDRVLSIDGAPATPGEHSRIDWRSDDATLPDPPVRALRCDAGETVRVRVERAPGDVRTLSVTAMAYSALEAAASSARVLDVGGVRIGYIHFWFMHSDGVDETLVRGLTEGPLTGCDALVLDLRGRGGSAGEAQALVRALGRHRAVAGLPVVGLIDKHTRSAKEVIAYEIRSRDLGLLVGERTAGAVVPGSFRDVGFDSVLMFPIGMLGEYSRAIEGVGVEPDLWVEDALVYSGDEDPILDAGVEAAARFVELLRATTAP